MTGAVTDDGPTLSEAQLAEYFPEMKELAIQENGKPVWVIMGDVARELTLPIAQIIPADKTEIAQKGFEKLINTYPAEAQYLLDFYYHNENVESADRRPKTDNCITLLEGMMNNQGIRLPLRPEKDPYVSEEQLQKFWNDTDDYNAYDKDTAIDSSIVAQNNALIDIMKAANITVVDATSSVRRNARHALLELMKAYPDAAGRAIEIVTSDTLEYGNNAPIYAKELDLMNMDEMALQKPGNTPANTSQKQLVKTQKLP